MIIGIGTDIVEVERIAGKIGKEQGFRELVYSAAEIVYCERMAHKFEHYAARFAAKEAFFKAIGTGWINGTAFNEIEVVGEDSGKPSLLLHGKTAEWAKQFNIGTMFISLSHVKTVAMAMVVLEKA